MDYTYPIVIGIILYMYIVVFNRTMKKYKKSDYSLTWYEFVTDTFPIERLLKSFTG